MIKEKIKIEKYYFLILLIGTILSVGWVLAIPTVPFSDFDYYHQIATSVATGGQWGDTYTTVGYSIALGFLYKLFGINIWVGKIFNLFLTVGSYLLMLGILNKINIKERDKKILFALFVLFPCNIFYNSVLGTEILFTNLVLLATYVYFSDVKYKFIWIGIITGLAAMVKQQFLAFFFAIFLVDIIMNKKLAKALTSSLIILFVSIVVVSPWIYRNTKLIGQFTTIANNGGIVLYINNNSQNQSGRWMPAADVENSIVKTEAYEKANQTEKKKMLSTAAKKWIVNHPKEFTILGFKRLYNTYFLGEDFGYATHGLNIGDYTNYTFMETYRFIKIIFFLPAILYILGYSIIILKHILKRDTEKLDKYKVYLVVYFHMFNSITFITEGQSRYSFPLTFAFIYCFYFFFINNAYSRLFRGKQTA